MVGLPVLFEKCLFIHVTPHTHPMHHRDSERTGGGEYGGSERAPSVILRPQCKNSEGKKNRKVGRSVARSVGRSVGRMGPPPEVEVPRKV